MPEPPKPAETAAAAAPAAQPAAPGAAAPTDRVKTQAVQRVTIAPAHPDAPPVMLAELGATPGTITVQSNGKVTLTPDELTRWAAAAAALVK